MCRKALRDVNVPKFLKDDLPLFEGIISDLFPGVERPSSDHGALLAALETSCRDMSLQAVQPFLLKCIQVSAAIESGRCEVYSSRWWRTTNCTFATYVFS